MAKVLIVDDEDSVRRVLSIQVKRMGHEAHEAANGRDAWSFLEQNDVDTVVTDLKMPEMDGLELLQRIRDKKPQIPVIMITAHGTIDTAVEAMKRGAFDYVTKPFNQEEFLKTLERAISSAQMVAREFQRSRSFLRQDEKIIGQTEEMERVYQLIERVANAQSPVLITGENGSGKEVVARLLHDKSERRQLPLVRAYLLSCPADQQGEQLFGVATKPGWIQLAEKGTLYLDEVGALTMESQGRLYNDFVAGKIEARIVAASDYNLLEKIEQGSFRKDLFYCLNAVPIYVPPLRDRTQDIEPLVDHFIKIFSKKFQKNVQRIDDEALFQLVQYPWPGNIRELENSIEYAVNVASTPVVMKENLPPHVFQTPGAIKTHWEKSQIQDAMRFRIEALEKDAIEEAIRSSQGDLLKASQKLGVPPSLLEERVKSLRIR